MLDLIFRRKFDVEVLQYPDEVFVVNEHEDDDVDTTTWRVRRQTLFLHFRHF